MDLGKLILMLSSPNDGEVVAAARAIDRLLKKEDKDWHWLVGHFKGTYPKIHYRMPWNTKKPHKALSVKECVEFLMDNQVLLTQEQFRFVKAQRNRTWDDLTARQKQYLNGLVSIVRKRRRE